MDLNLSIFGKLLVEAFFVFSSAQTISFSIKSASKYVRLSSCLPTNLALFSKSVFNDLHCNSLCNLNANCSMYMLVSQMCYLYANMTYMYFSTIAYVPNNGTCKVYSTGWVACPASKWVLDNKYYYLYSEQMSFQNAMNFCRAAYLQPLKIKSEAERLYIDQTIQAQDTGSPKYYWTSLYGKIPANAYSATYNLTWQSDGSVIQQTAFPKSSWFIDGLYEPNLFCWIVFSDGRITDNSCDSSGHYAGRPLCTCE